MGAAALACGLIFLVAGALADAGNPILGTIKATAQDNGDGTVTIFVRGQWNWLSHNNDCNQDRNGTGVGIIWNDPTEPGFTVTKAPISAGVGIASLRPGDTVNKIDEMVHPVDRGNIPEGYTVAGTDYPAGQQFVDPDPPGVTAAQLAAWRGGCGRIPLAATASKGNHPERTGVTCGDGTLACSGHPWGSWGYEKNGGKGYAHTYLKTALPDKVCANFYDVHGSNAGLQPPNGTKEIDVNDNGDNSIETNSFNVNNGANCIAVALTTTATVIHNAAHNVVTAVAAGTTVHDAVTVTSLAGTPTGNVTFDWFTNGTCTGQPAAVSGNFALVNGSADATAFPQTPATPGMYGFKAHYLGDGNQMLPSDGPCEPLRVVDANIQITPANATNKVGTNHVLTGHVNVNDGIGFVNAPAGTAIGFAIISGPGSFVGGNSCLTSGATGSCTVTITSSSTGTTVVRASTDVTVAGVSVHRETGDGKAGDSADANKAWANARISIAPSATNEIGQSHTFTVTLEKDTGTGAFVPAPGEHVDVTLTDAAGASHSAATGTCTIAGPNTNAGGQCTITFTSGSAGTVTGHASATLNINGAIVAVETSGTAGNSGDAVKAFVDANIQITPANAINPVGTNHVLTAHVNVNTGSGGLGNAPNGTTISFTIDSGPGSLSSSTCTTAGGTGSCTTTLTSSTPGTTVVSAHVTLTIGGVTLTRHTNGTASNSGPATKLFADATARTDILNSSNNVVTTVAAGTIVHDIVFVAKTANTPATVPNPTGSVIFHRYSTIDCTGAAVNQTVALTPGSPSTAISDSFATVANMSYRAEYLGDANYPARTGACEPLNVTPLPQGSPGIAIVKNPKSQTVANGGTATFTITVTNIGNVTLTDVTVTDPLSPNCNRTKADIPALASMASGASITYTCTRPNVTANFDNVATATGMPPSGPPVSASDTAPVKRAALTPAKKKVTKKKKPKVVSHKKPKATG